jgi:protocatechuate 3,4-dioxygenase beta subunit
VPPVSGNARAQRPHGRLSRADIPPPSPSSGYSQGTEHVLLNSLSRNQPNSFTIDLATRDRPSADKWIDVSHEDKPGHSRDHPSLFNYREGEDPKYNNTGCALTPTSLYGPYWLEGQKQRQDIRAGQRGIYLRLALQIIDASRCLPLHGAQVDIWHANSMGEYSREAGGYLRGWQLTDRYGAVDFDTNFHGHYTDRASHIHVVVRAVNEKRVIHFGQIYFDQKIRDDVEVSYPQPLN